MGRISFCRSLLPALPSFPLKSGVLDRDRRLLRESLYQSDLVGRKSPWLAAEEEDRTIGVAFADQRNCEHGTKPKPPRI